MTTITGPLLDSYGQLNTTELHLVPTSVPGFDAKSIKYLIMGGDLTGAMSGFGSSMRDLRPAPLALEPGIYTATLGVGGPKYTWTIPASGSVTIQSLLV